MRTDKWQNVMTRRWIDSNFTVGRASAVGQVKPRTRVSVFTPRTSGQCATICNSIQDWSHSHHSQQRSDRISKVRSEILNMLNRRIDNSHQYPWCYIKRTKAPKIPILTRDNHHHRNGRSLPMRQTVKLYLFQSPRIQQPRYIPNLLFLKKRFL
jgi:hypothetical protein